MEHFIVPLLLAVSVLFLLVAFTLSRIENGRN